MGSVLAIDADPNSCFAGALGIKEPETIVGICDDISKNMSQITPGMTKERFIEMRVQSSLEEADGFDLLVMGAPEGPGCYCYVNNLLRDVISRLTKSYDFVVIDNAAGMEHISRRTAGSITKLVLVSDYSISGLRAVRKIYELTKQLKVKVQDAIMVINRASGPIEKLDSEIKATGLESAGVVPYSESLVEWNISDRSVFEFNDKALSAGIGTICARILGR